MRKPHPLIATLLILALLLGATWLRATHFNEWPPGLSHDEAINGIDALRLADTGVIPYYLRDGRPEPLFRVFLMFGVGLIGPTRFGLRIVSLFFGVLGIAAAYRAGRHLVKAQSAKVNWRHVAGLIAAATLAVMVGHIHLSRVSYRAIMMVFALLMFYDAINVAAQSGKRNEFLKAGGFLGWALMSYTSAFAALPVAALGGLWVLVRSLKERTIGQSIRSVAWMALAFLIVVSPLIVMFNIQPALYGRAGDVVKSEERTLQQSVSHYVERIGITWEGVYRIGDINPQYNVAQTPLLPIQSLYWLLLAGIAACLLRWRRLSSWLALALLFMLLLPVAFADEIPHGLRVSGEFAAIPLVMAASVNWIQYLTPRSPLRIRTGEKAVFAFSFIRAFVLLALTSVFLFAAVRSATIYQTYMTSDIRWGGDGVVSAFSWFFETQRLTVAQAIAHSDDVIYVPLTETYHPSFRYFTRQSHPRITTWAAYFGADAPITLPAGRFLIVPWKPEETTFAAFMPDGALVLLPRFDDATLESLHEATANSDEKLIDPYNETAAIVVDWDQEITLDQPIMHRVDINYADQFRMVGWAGPAALPPAGEQARITVYFTPNPRIHRDVTIFAQLWSVGLDRLSSSDEPLLLRWTYPPDWWLTNDIVPFAIEIPVPDGLTPGAYYVAVGLRDYLVQNLPILGADGTPVAETAIAGTVKVPRPDPIPTDGMIEANAEFADQIELIGYRSADPSDADVDTLAAGETVTITLYWRAIRRPDADYTVFLHLTDPSGALIAQNDTQPQGGQYPTSIWDAGEIVTTTHVMTIPPDAAAPFSLYAGWYSFPSLERLVVMQDGVMSEDRRALVLESK